MLLFALCRIYQHLEFAAWEGHTEAQERVAMAYLMGEHLSLNITGAKDLFELLQAKGNPVGQMVKYYLKKIL